MSTAAYIASAIQDKWTAMTFSGKPTLWPERAPLKDASGAAVNPPYAEVYTDDAGTSEHATGMAIETVRVRFEVYGLTKASVRANARGVMYDAGDPGDRDGFDDPETLTIGGGVSLNAMYRTGPGAVTEEAGRSLDAGIVYRCVLNYVCEVITTAA